MFQVDGQTRRLLYKHRCEQRKIVEIFSLVGRMRTLPVDMAAIYTPPMSTGCLDKKHSTTMLFFSTARVHITHDHGP